MSEDISRVEMIHRNVRLDVRGKAEEKQRDGSLVHLGSGDPTSVGSGRTPLDAGLPSFWNKSVAYFLRANQTLLYS